MDKCLHILVVDDDKLYVDFISASLSSKKYVIYDSNDIDTTISVLDKNRVDCVILDYNLGTENGLRIAELIRNKYSDPPPLIMLTGEGGERTIIKAFRGGFSDFVSKKKLNLDELVGAIRGAVERKENERSDRAERNRIASLSSFDGMTGLYTAGFMKGRVEELSASADRRGGECGVIAIRLDQLEFIGDRFGHLMRDRALRAFASRLRAATGQADTSGRNSEDSFLYLLERDASPAAILAACERLSRDLSFEANFDTASFSFTPIIGAALFPLDGTNVEQLLAAADLACERAILSGRLFATASPLPSEPSAGRPCGAGAPSASEIGFAGSSGLLTDRQTNRRMEPRRRVLKRGKILANGLESVVDCMLRDLSTTGARLRMNHLYTPPDRFDLMIVDSGNKQSVDVRWRFGDDIGVQFVSARI